MHWPMLPMVLLSRVKTKVCLLAPSLQLHCCISGTSHGTGPSPYYILVTLAHTTLYHNRATELQQSSHHTVVEAARVPHPVVPPRPSMEVHAVGAVKHVDAIVGVLAGVAVHNVDQHHQA